MVGSATQDRVDARGTELWPDAPLDRAFNVDQPNRVWAGDISYVWTAQGWLYLAVVLDLYSRAVIGWAMSERITDDFTLDALDMALARRRPPPGLLHHSDRGSMPAATTRRSWRSTASSAA